jgi:putative nucleotidyltransferase with HDIG domain
MSTFFSAESMMFSQVIYRVQQFWLAWRAQSLTDEELAPARSVLTAEQMQLFHCLQPGEQIHALRVLHTVLQQGGMDSDLQTAALLHDIGKARAPLKLWERVVIVLGKSFFPERAKSWGEGQPQGIFRPFVIAEQHPAWGGEMASEVGASPVAVSLIRRHQTPEDFPPVSDHEEQLLKILQTADHQH